MTPRDSRYVLFVCNRVCTVALPKKLVDAAQQELISRKARLAYPIRDGIPIMLPEEARKID